MRRAAYDKKRRCPVCLKEFWAARYKAVYCSATCRQRGHRKPAMEEQLGRYYDEAHSGIMALVAVHDRGLVGFRAQKRLQSLCIAIIQAVNDQTRGIIYDQLKDDFFRLYRDKQLSRYRPEESDS